MPETQYPKNPNTDTAFVTDDQGKRTRAVKTVVLDGTIDYPKNSNSTNCYITVDGKKQRALMTADISSEGTVEYPENSNSTKGYVTVDGKKQRVVLTAALVGGGSQPTGTLQITTNGTHDVSEYAEADVQVPTPAHYIEKSVDANGILINSTNIINLNGVTDVGNYVLSYAYYYVSFPANTSADLSSLTTISGANACNNMFNGCTGITSANLSSLTTISGNSSCQNIFSSCTGLVSADLSSLTTISGDYACQNMFSGCTGLVSADLSSLTTISGNSSCQGIFSSCTGLVSADLSSLTTISGNYACRIMFSGCTSLATVYIGGITAIDFGTRTNQFTNMFQYCAQNIDVYAPAGNQTAIEAMSGYPNFGGTGTVTWHWNS